MLFWTIFKSSINSLLANKMRSLLAMLGIIIGVGAVIAMLAMGAGAQAQIIANIQSMGTNLLVIRPAQRGTGGVMSGTQQNMTVDDAIALRNLPGVEAVSPSVGGNVQVKYQNKNFPVSITGGSVTYFQIRNFVVDEGRQFTEGEAEGLARVAVIGPVTAVNLFGNDSPLGEQVKVKGINFTVIGVTKSKGDQGWNNPDDQIIVPYTTAMKILFGQDYLKEIDLVCAERVDLNDVSGEPATVDPWHRDGFVHETAPTRFDRRTSAETPSPSGPLRRRRFPRAKSGGSDRHPQSKRRHLPHPARLDCLHLAAGRRNRHHEHHARDRHRTHP